MSTLNTGQPSFEYTHSVAYAFSKIKQAADIASLRDPGQLDAIIGFLGDPNPTVRYWGANGCLILKEKAAPAREALLNVLDDDTPDVRIAAAEALCHLGASDAAIPVFIAALDSDNEMVRVHALNSLQIIGGEVAVAALPKVKEVVAAKPEGRGYDLRAAQHVIEVYGE